MSKYKNYSTDKNELLLSNLVFNEARWDGVHMFFVDYEDEKVFCAISFSKLFYNQNDAIDFYNKQKGLLGNGYQKGDNMVFTFSETTNYSIQITSYENESGKTKWRVQFLFTDKELNEEFGKMAMRKALNMK